MEKTDKDKSKKKTPTRFGDNPRLIFEINLNHAYCFGPENSISLKNIILSPKTYAKVLKKIEEIHNIILEE